MAGGHKNCDALSRKLPPHFTLTSSFVNLSRLVFAALPGQQVGMQCEEPEDAYRGADLRYTRCVNPGDVTAYGCIISDFLKPCVSVMKSHLALLIFLVV